MFLFLGAHARNPSSLPAESLIAELKLSAEQVEAIKQHREVVTNNKNELENIRMNISQVAANGSKPEPLARAAHLHAGQLRLPTTTPSHNLHCSSSSRSPSTCTSSVSL